MRILVLALMCALFAGSAMAQKAASDATTSGQGLAPPPIPSGKKSEGIDTKGVAEESSEGLTFVDVEGAWTGTVDEVDQDPYTINLSFRPGGLGEVSYSGYNCTGVLSPEAQGENLVFQETIVLGRDVCADGTVVLTLKGAEMTWLWINELQEIQATAVLRRVP